MGQHAKQYAEMGAKSVLGIDISEKMLDFAKQHHAAENIEYRRLAMEDVGRLGRTFDLITSSLVFDYAEDLAGLMKDIRTLMRPDAAFVFSMSHPLATSWDGAYDRYTRTETGERLYANIRNYGLEGLRSVKWVVDGYEVYHRTFATIVNALAGAGFIIEECQEAHVSDELREKYPAMFGGVIHKPDFVFFRCKVRE